MNHPHSPIAIEHDAFNGRPINGSLLLTYPKRLRPCVSRARPSIGSSRAASWHGSKSGRLAVSLRPGSTALSRPTPKPRPNASRRWLSAASCHHKSDASS
jgi:hypothetical protein